MQDDKERRNVEGVKVEETGEKQWQKDYRESDMEVLFRRGDWHDWDDAIHWLEKFGEQDNELTPGEVVAMKEDLQRLKQSGAQFVKDPHQVYQQAHR